MNKVKREFEIVQELLEATEEYYVFGEHIYVDDDLKFISGPIRYTMVLNSYLPFKEIIFEEGILCSLTFDGKEAKLTQRIF